MTETEELKEYVRRELVETILEMLEGSGLDERDKLELVGIDIYQLIDEQIEAKLKTFDRDKLRLIIKSI